MPKTSKIDRLAKEKSAFRKGFTEFAKKALEAGVIDRETYQQILSEGDPEWAASEIFNPKMASSWHELLQRNHGG